MVGVVHSDRDRRLKLIIVKQAPAGFIAQLYEEDEPVFNTELEAHLQIRLEAGDRTAVPAPPHIKYGPGGQRFTRHSWLHETGSWCPSLPEAIASLRSRKRVKAAEERIRRAAAKLEFERKRLAGLLGPQRVFEEDSFKEITP
jgi:hypothetical protein